MHLLSTILLAISSNLDNLGVGVSCGARKIAIPPSANLIIALVTSLGTLFSVSFGEMVASFLPAGAANLLGALIIVAAGFWVIILDKKKPGSNGQPISNGGPTATDPPEHGPPRLKKLSIFLKQPHRADMDSSGHISNTEAVFLALALTINNFSAGIGAGISGLNALLTTLLTGIFSALTTWLGVSFGSRYISRWVGDRAGMIAGLLIIFIGICEYFL
jgi:putative sporulation protein YtaF